MNGPIDLVRRLEDWLAEEDGAARLPERVMDAVTAASGAMPQVRRRDGWLAHGAMRLALGAALLSGAALLVFGLYRFVAPPVGTASPSPSATASVIESPSTEPSAADNPNLYVSPSLGFAVIRPAEIGPSRDLTQPSGPPATLTFPAGTCVYDLCWGRFEVAVGTYRASSLEQLASVVRDSSAAGFDVAVTATRLDGEPAISLASSQAEGSALLTFRAVVALHGGQSYVLIWAQTYGGALSVPQSLLTPLWIDFVDSFTFLVHP